VHSVLHLATSYHGLTDNNGLREEAVIDNRYLFGESHYGCSYGDAGRGDDNSIAKRYL
jgi:hypothetical protein